VTEILFPFFGVVEGLNDSREVGEVIWSGAWIVGEGNDGGGGGNGRGGDGDHVTVITCVVVVLGRVIAAGCAALVVASICHSA